MCIILKFTLRRYVIFTNTNTSWLQKKQKTKKPNKQKQNKQKFLKHKNRRPMGHNARISTLCLIENNKTIWIYNVSLRGIDKRNLCRLLLIPMHEELHTFTVHKNNMFKRKISLFKTYVKRWPHIVALSWPEVHHLHDFKIKIAWRYIVEWCVRFDFKNCIIVLTS